jgi:hypothetical protein
MDWTHPTPLAPKIIVSSESGLIKLPRFKFSHSYLRRPLPAPAASDSLHMFKGSSLRSPRGGFPQVWRCRRLGMEVQPSPRPAYDEGGLLQAQPPASNNPRDLDLGGIQLQGTNDSTSVPTTACHQF